MFRQSLDLLPAQTPEHHQHLLEKKNVLLIWWTVFFLIESDNQMQSPASVMFSWVFLKWWYGSQADSSTALTVHTEKRRENCGMTLWGDGKLWLQVFFRCFKLLKSVWLSWTHVNCKTEGYTSLVLFALFDSRLLANKRLKQTGKDRNMLVCMSAWIFTCWSFPVLLTCACIDLIVIT